MDSRPNIRTTWSTLLRQIFLIIAILILVGCPDPNYFIKFCQGKKHVEEYKVDLIKDVLRLKMVAGGLLYNTTGKSGLGYDLQLVYKPEYGHIELYPESLEVWFDETKLEVVKFTADTSESKDKIVYWYSYSYYQDLSQDFYKLYKENRLETDFLKFYLGNVIYLDSEKLHLDTIYATSKQASSARQIYENMGW